MSNLADKNTLKCSSQRKWQVDQQVRSKIKMFLRLSPTTNTNSKYRNSNLLRVLSIAAFFLYCLVHSEITLAKTNSNKGIDDLSYFSIPKTDIQSAIVMLAEQANIQIIYVQEEELGKLIVGPIYGRMRSRKALTLLLADTPLKFRSNANYGTIVFSQKERINTEHSAPIQKTSALFHESHQLEEVVINGIRSSLSKALSEKREKVETEDYLFQQTISKYPDHNAAEALQRLSGISVDRYWGESQDVFIRGTSREYNQTLVNGQYFASAYWMSSEIPGRSFNYFLVPSDLLASIQVNKGPSASLPEGSIGGTVNLRLRTPFSLPHKFLRVSHKQHFSELSDSFSPKNNLTANWKNKHSTFGVTLNINHQKRDTRRDGLEVLVYPLPSSINTAEDGIISDVFFPFGISSTLHRQKRDRLSYHLASQWAPTSNSTFTFNVMRSEMNFSNDNHNYIAIPIYSVFSNSPLLDTRIVNNTFGSNVLTHASTSDASLIGSRQVLIIRDTYVNNSLYDLSYQHLGDEQNIFVQLGITKANGGSDHELIYNFDEETRLSYLLERDQINFDVLDIDPMSPDYAPPISSHSDSIRRSKDQSAHLQIDGEFFSPNDPFFTLKLGYKWQKHGIKDKRKAGEITPYNEAWQTIGNVNFRDLVADEQTTLHRRSINNGDAIQNYPILDPHRVRQEINDSLAYSDYQYVPVNDYNVTETINTIYLQTEFETLKHSFNAGVRAIYTDIKSNTLQNGNVLYSKHRYYKFLPSANWKYGLGNNSFLRANISKAISRPYFSQSNGGSTKGDLLLTDAYGNPELRPMESKQGEFGFEHYSSQSSIFAAYYFHKKLSNIVYADLVDTDISDFRSAIPVFKNGEGPELKGIEIQWQQDIVKHIGLSLNYTYTDIGDIQYYANKRHELAGSSRDQLNTSIYFENKKLSARLSYNLRSKSFDAFNSDFQMEIQAYDQWDMDISYSFNDKLSVSFEGINLLNETVRVSSLSGIPVSLYENGSHYIIGVQYSFW